jgi:hypothetical protein
MFTRRNGENHSPKETAEMFRTDHSLGNEVFFILTGDNSNNNFSRIPPETRTEGTNL